MMLTMKRLVSVELVLDLLTEALLPRRRATTVVGGGARGVVGLFGARVHPLLFHQTGYCTN